MRKWYAALAVVVLLTGLAAVWQFVYHGVSPRLIISPPPVERPPPAALDELAAVDVTKLPLRDVLEVLARQHDVNIVLDAAALKDRYLTGDELVTCHLSGVSLRSMLNMLVGQVDPALFIATRDGEILVTTRSHWSWTLNNHVSRVHLLAPLLAGPRELDEAALVTVVKRTIAPLTWSDVGGAGVIEVLPGALVVSQTPDVQEQIADLLRVLAELSHRDSFTSLPIADPAAEQNAAVLRALDSPANIQVANMPLSTFARELSDQHGITIWIDETALQTFDISRDKPVTYTLTNLSLCSALKSLLRELELSFVVQDGILVITTPEKAHEKLTLRAYPVADLVPSSLGVDGDSLTQTVKVSVASYPWVDAGGLGWIAYYPGVLVVAQTWEVHKQLERALGELRQAVHHAAAPNPPSAESAALQWIEAALRKRISVNYVDVPLNAAIEGLADRAGVNIQIGIVALGSAGISLDKPVTFSASDEPLWAALSSLLQPLELTFCTRDEVLLVTTPEDAERETLARFYRLRSFPRGDPWRYTARELADLIPAVVAPQTWPDGTGPGPVEVLGDVLVVPQMEAQLRRIEALLAALDRLRADPAATEPIDIEPFADDFTAALFRALQQPAKIDVTGVPLDALTRRLSEQYRVPIRIDERALTGEGIVAGTPITDSIDGVSLHSALQLLLAHLELTAVVRDGAIWITAATSAEHALHLRVYPVRDLCPPDSDRDTRHLAELIKSSILARTWDDVGGPGGVYDLPGVLFVSNTLPVHRGIENLLTALRRQKLAPHDLTPIEIRDTACANDERISAALKKSIAVSFDHVPLEDALRQLSEQHQVPIHIDRHALTDVGIDSRSPVSAKLTDVNLGTALECLLRNINLSYSLQFGTLLVEPAEQTDQRTILRVNSVADVQEPVQTVPGDVLDRTLEELAARNAPARGFGGPVETPPESALHKAVEMCLLGPDRTSDQRAVEFGSSLIVRGTQDRLRSVAMLLRDLRLGGSPAETPPLEKLVAALSKPVSLHCRAVRLGEVANLLSMQVEVPVWVDSTTASSDSINTHCWIDCDIENRPLVEAIRLLTIADGSRPDPFLPKFPELPSAETLDSQRRLDIVARGEALLITARGSHETAAMLPIVKVYNVRDLMGRFPDLDERRFVELVSLVVPPLTWVRSVRPVETLDGWETVFNSEATMEMLDDRLVVRQIPPNHRAVEKFLQWLADDEHGLPRPAELARKENQQAVERLVAAIRTTHDPLVRSYGVALLSTLDIPAPDVTALLVDVMSGSEAHAALIRALDMNDWKVFPRVLDELDRLGPPAVVVVPQLLDRLTINYSEENQVNMAVLAAVDPRFWHTREVLKQWDNDADAQRRDRAVEVRAMLRKQFPDAMD